MPSKFIRNGNKTVDRMKMMRQTEYLVPHIYAAIACELWDMGWESEQIQDLFAKSQERWQDSERNGWDMLQNVADVTGIDVQYFKKTGNIV
jgi:hypothetical protein